MELTVEITPAARLPALMEAFRHSGCDAAWEAPTRCQILHAADSEREARLEVAFFLRAWQLRHPDTETKIC